MRVLLLGSENAQCEMVRDRITAEGDTVDFVTSRLTDKDVKALAPEIMVSYNYRFILPEQVLTIPPRGALNLHVSYLPWNKGADPNFWSIAEDTPKGVTIHYMDKRLDTGDIIAQEKIIFGSEETLKTSYGKLHTVIQELFFDNWKNIKNGSAQRIKQTGGGTYHKKSDREPFAHLMARREWDTPLEELAGLRLNHVVIHQ